jgi:DNA-binding winged helix-turn-helix (wHTH) protein
VGSFRWLDAGSIPAAYDLRRCGWTLVERGSLLPEDILAVLPFGQGCDPDSVAPPERAATLLVGVDLPSNRAALLRAGYGDVVGLAPGLDEFEARAARVVALAQYEPPIRRHGELELDLLARDAFVAGRAVGLHPREFALLWRLMAAAGAPLGKARLLADVWKLHYVPETNSLPVHVSRLRRKLAEVGFPALIATGPEGYAYVPPPNEARPALKLPAGLHGLDAHVRIADEARGASSRIKP